MSDPRLGPYALDLDLWKRLAEQRGKLLACYRLKRAPPAALLDDLAAIKDHLEALGYNPRNHRRAPPEPAS